MAYCDVKDLTRRTASDKYCVMKHLILLKIQNMMNIKEVFLQCFLNFLIKKLLGYIDKLDDIVNKYNAYRSTIKMKPADVKSSTYINSSKEINYQDPKFKILIMLDIKR